MSTQMTTRVVLTSLPTGLPSDENFRVEEVPVGDLSDGEVLLRTRFVSVDANLRAHDRSLDGSNNVLFAGCLIEADGVGEVVHSSHSNYQPGQLVIARTGWQSHARLHGDTLHHLTGGPLQEETALFALGTASRTSYVGLKYTSGYKAGETLVVPAATGLLGSMAGQFARMAGLWTVGIVSNPEECVFVRQRLGFHSSLSFQDPEFERLLTEACTERGIDIFFETIGGALWRSIRPLMKKQGRVVLTGSWAQYNHAYGGAAEYGNSATIQAVIEKPLLLGVPDRNKLRFDEFYKEVAQGVADGSIWLHVMLEEGLQKAPMVWMTAIDQPGGSMIAIRV